MLRVNPRVTFLSKIGYIFIEFGSEWLKSHDSKRPASNDSSLIVFLFRLCRHVLVPSRILFKGRGYAD